MKLVLVTGGAGFLGAHLCARLLNDGESVICLDDFSTGRRENVAHLRQNPRFSLLEHDVKWPFTAFEKTVVPEEIYNLACPASPAQYQRDPVRTIKTSILGMINVLELARRTGAKVLQASTSEVYGDPLEHPQREGYWGHVNPIGPRACYDEGKRAAETLCSDYVRQYELDVRVARIFNTYGPGMREDDGRVVSNFICQALQGKPLTVHGDGAQSRSFCYVDDLIEGLVRLMAWSGASRLMNLGNPQEITVGALALIILELCETHSHVEFDQLPQDDPTRRCPDIAVAQALLDWTPRIPLALGLQRTVAYFRSLHEVRDAQAA